jgi:hypothetical protein
MAKGKGKKKKKKKKIANTIPITHFIVGIIDLPTR